MNENMTSNPTPMNAPRSQSNLLMVVGIVAVVAVVVFVVLQMNASRVNTEQLNTETNVIESEETMDHDAMTLPTTTQGQEETVISEDASVSLEVEGGSYYYRPNVIRVKQGATVTITLNSVDMMHDFVIDELGVQSDIIPGGRSTTVTFVADEVGEFEFYCSVSDHRQMGMVGTLIVEE